MPQRMHLKVLLPFRVFADVPEVTRAVVETSAGALGLLPRRLDCAAAVVPGILTYQRHGAEEEYIALNEGILVKSGPEVLISVRNAIGGADLGRLREAVERDFSRLEAAERSCRAVLARLESDLVRRLVKLQHER